MPVFECSECLPTNVSDKWTIERKAEIGLLIRTKGLLFASNYYRPIELDLKDVNGIYIHVTREKGICNRCKTVLTEHEGQCPKCKRLNLDW